MMKSKAKPGEDFTSVSLEDTGATPEELSPRGFTQPFRIDFLYFLDRLEQPCPAGDAVCFEAWGDGKADGFFRAACIGDDKVGYHRIKLTFDALNRGVK
jgi:hypothetical protein